MFRDPRFRLLREPEAIRLLAFLLWPHDPADHAEHQAAAIWRAFARTHDAVTQDRRCDPVDLLKFFLRERTDREAEHAWAAWVAAGRKLVAELPAIDRVTVRLRRSLDRPIRDAESVVALPLPVDGAGYVITDTVVEAAEPDLVWRRSGQRIELVWPGHRIEPLVVTLQVTLAYSAEQRVRWQQDDRDLARYLEPRTGFVRVTPAIQALSRRLVHPDAPASDAIRVFWDYIGDRVRIGLAHHCQLLGTQPGEVVLDHGWADCVLASSLLVSLSRAHGLPARVVHGRLLYKQAPAPHAWAEVWMPDQGWVPFDLMAWNLAGDDDERGRWSDRFFGKLEPRIVHEVPPYHSPGVVGAPLSRRWIAYATRDLEGGVETRVMDLDGTITFRESYQVEW